MHSVHPPASAQGPPQPLNDNTKILTETDTATFSSIPNFQKPRSFFQDQIIRNRNRYFFFRDQIFRNQNQDFFSETKFSETDTETLQKLAKVSRPRPKLFNILANFWSYLLQIFSSFSFSSLFLFSSRKKDILLLRIFSSFFFSVFLLSGIERQRQRSSLCFPPSNRYE